MSVTSKKEKSTSPVGTAYKNVLETVEFPMMDCILKNGIIYCSPVIITLIAII